MKYMLEILANAQFAGQQIKFLGGVSMKNKDMVFGIEMLILILCVGIGFIRYPQRGFDIQTVLELLLCFGACLYMIYQIEVFSVMSRKGENLLNTQSKYFKYVKYFLCGVLEFIIMAVGIFLFSLWADKHIEFVTLLWLAGLFMVNHIFLKVLFFINSVESKQNHFI